MIPSRKNANKNIVANFSFYSSKITFFGVICKIIRKLIAI